MKNLQIEEIYELYTQTAGVCTDTRNILPGGMFFALKGDTFNGNAFALAAIQGGAAYAVVDEAEVEVADQEHIILVEDVLVALQQMARHHRKQFRIPVVALTGTNGKTTTKELIAACLSKKYKVVATQGNLNNHIGVPLTLLRLDSETQAAVIEMGASNPGEIDTLVKLVCPSFGLITNVGKAHLQGFGSLEGVMATKGELYDNLNEHRKIAFVNVDNPLLVKMAVQRPRMQTVPYGVKNDSAKIVVDEGGSPFLSLVIPNPCFTAVNENGAPEWLTIRTNLIGAYNADNVLAAMCVSSYLDVDTNDAIAAIAEYVPSNNRSQLAKTEKNSLIVDAYNANPTSMRASIENFATLNMPGKVLMLGDMLELGTDSVQEHKGILKLAAECSFEQIYLVGKEFATACAQLQSELPGFGATLFEDSLQLQQHLKEKPLSGCSILIKGSRGKRLERVIEAL
ncbi:MAG: UDP-N-acetylmuramoyl-tripeptide--D-alanyl-D-alanine ligase [Bacteroidales bacterium]|nr:UDP-N-acetylmuramoyl-tripeptide--D-alanyl-D-alanine ligase [Bacteroidales bacterium]